MEKVVEGLASKAVDQMELALLKLLEEKKEIPELFSGKVDLGARLQALTFEAAPGRAVYCFDGKPFFEIAPPELVEERSEEGYRMRVVMACKRL